jgi:hypothetical protein
MVNFRIPILRQARPAANLAGFVFSLVYLFRGDEAESLTVCAGDYSKLDRKWDCLDPHPGNKFFIGG